MHHVSHVLSPFCTCRLQPTPVLHLPFVCPSDSFALYLELLDGSTNILLRIISMSACTCFVVILACYFYILPLDSCNPFTLIISIVQ